MRTIEKELALANIIQELAKNPKNKRRTRNKIVTDNASFELIFDTLDESLKINKKEDLYFSIIPYDTSRKYIHLAIFLYLTHPEKVDEYLERHHENLLQYILISLFQMTGERFSLENPEVQYEFHQLQTNLYFKLQVVGRLMQHDETGPLSATLPYKFLYDLNEKTGIHGYIAEYLRFIQVDLAYFPLKFGNQGLYLVEETQTVEQVTTALSMMQQAIIKPLRKSELTQGQTYELSQIRKNYRPQSQHPSQRKQYFTKANTVENTANINVVSDLHAMRGQLELNSPHFNIIAGDLSNSYATNETLRGIAVIGNHDILECALEENSQLDPQFIEKFTGAKDIDFSVLRIDDAVLYQKCKERLEERYTELTFLNNQSYYYQGIRYIGLTIPVSFRQNKKRVQAYLTNLLYQLLERDKEIPTVIISHAPLFSELSLLSRRHKKYHQEFICVNQELERLFAEYHIIGIIHGHHHIPASSGVLKYKQFAGKKLFVICSIYSEMNQGFDLQKLLLEEKYRQG